MPLAIGESDSNYIFIASQDEPGVLIIYRSTTMFSDSSKETIECKRLVEETKVVNDFDNKVFRTKRLRPIGPEEPHFKQALRKIAP